jgi:hypothetical protein
MNLLETYHHIWVDGWNNLWFKLWSVRANLGAGLIEVIDFGWSIYANVNPNLWVQGLSILIHFAAPVLRGLKQTKLS